MALSLFFSIASAWGQVEPDSLQSPESPIILDTTTILDSSLVQNDSLILDSMVLDSLAMDSLGSDSVSADSSEPKQSGIKNKINYNSRDSIMVDVMNQRVFIFGDAHVDYGRITLEADYIEIDWMKNLLIARPTTDSIGDLIGIPYFKEGSAEYQAHEIKYNFKTEEGIIKKVVTQQGEGYVHGETVKKTSEDDLYIKNAKYTTCNMEHPHFYIHSQKMKMVPDKVVVSGPFHVVVEDVPTPLGFPFGIFPVPKEKSSGIIMPQPGFTSNRGFSIQGGGYYWAPNDYLRIKLTGDYFTNGSWRSELSSDYIYRYHYGGNFTFGLSEVYTGFTRPERVGTGLFAGREYTLQWNHTQLAKRKGNFSARVNMQSDGYGQLNYMNVQKRLQNVFYGTVTYRMDKIGKTPFSFVVNLDNRNQKGKSTFTLPDFTFNVRRRTPFKMYSGAGKELIKNFNFTYSSNFKYKVENIENPIYGAVGAFGTPVVGEGSYGDTIQFDFGRIPRILQNGKYGFLHKTQIQNPLKFRLGNANITANPNMNIQQSWFDKRLEYAYNHDSLKLEVNEVQGLYNRLDYNYGINFSTTVYAKTINLGPHFPVFKNFIQPSAGFQYTPNFSDRKFGYLQDVQTDQYGNHQELFIYNNFVNVSRPSDSEKKIWSFGLRGNVKMDYYKKTDTADVKKSIPLIKSYAISTSYNTVPDTLNWSPTRVQINSSFFNNKLNLNYTSSHSFYKVDTNSSGGVTEVNKFYYRNLANPLRTTAATINMSTGFSGKKKRKTKTEIDSTDVRQMAELMYIEAHPEEFIDFSVPWNIRMNYILNWSKNPFADKDNVTQTVSLTGDVSLSPKLKINGTVNYDIVNKGYSSITLGFVRDLHCWNWSLDWQYMPRSGHSIQFMLQARSSMLQDLLKVRKRVGSYIY